MDRAINMHLEMTGLVCWSARSLSSFYPLTPAKSKATSCYCINISPQSPVFLTSHQGLHLQSLTFFFFTSDIFLTSIGILTLHRWYDGGGSRALSLPSTTTRWGPMSVMCRPFRGFFKQGKTLRRRREPQLFSVVLSIATRTREVKR